MDKYDKAVEYLIGCNGNYAYELEEAWKNPQRHKGGSLFQFAGKGAAMSIGCLTMIRNGAPGCCVQAGTSALTKAIKEDERLPRRFEDITKDHLPIFAEWQRCLDKELNREEIPCQTK